MIPHDIVFQVLPVPHRDSELPFRIHDVHPRNIGKTVILRSPQMVLRPGAFASVSRIAFHDGAVHPAHQVFD